jgi:hypothetical protein
MHNAAMKGRMVRGPARDGSGLLAGLLLCGHCGRKLHVTYTGKASKYQRYACQGAMVNHGVGRCISFGGFGPEGMIAQELLRRLEPLSLEAALAAIDGQGRGDDERLKQKQLSLEHARFEVARARRQYDAVDPDNRLVAAEPERRWNETLKIYNELEQELGLLRASQPTQMRDTTRESLLMLGRDLPALWNHPQSSSQPKRRIVRALLQEIIVKKANERISMILHWQGGDHTTLEFLMSKGGKHRYASPENLVIFSARSCARTTRSSDRRYPQPDGSAYGARKYMDRDTLAFISPQIQHRCLH